MSVVGLVGGRGVGVVEDSGEVGGGRGCCSYAYLCSNSENVKTYPKNARYDFHAFPDTPRTPYESIPKKYDGNYFV